MVILSELKKFNEIVSKEIEQAKLYEKNQLWKKAKQEWLDIIEYCLLFAKKTPNLKPNTAKMIIDKAQGLLTKAEQLDAKIKEEEYTASMGAKLVPPVGMEEPKIVDEEEEQDLTSTEGESPPSPEESGPTGGSSINVGDQAIDVPDDFPLKEITPKDSFREPKVKPDRTTIDSTKYYMDDDGSGVKKPPKKTRPSV
jgi:hypothetical protein